MSTSFRFDAATGMPRRRTAGRVRPDRVLVQIRWFVGLCRQDSFPGTKGGRQWDGKAPRIRGERLLELLQQGLINLPLRPAPQRLQPFRGIFTGVSVASMPH